MALKGTLADIDIIDLIQFPHTGRRTGELILTTRDQQGSLYYDKGSLVHAYMDNAEGMEALVGIVDWTEGSFEFLSDSEPTRKTLDMDLHRAVMQALKLHDERKEENERRRAEESVENKGEVERLSSNLTEFVSSTDFALHACVISPDGSVKAAADCLDGPQEGVEELRDALHALLQTYPRRKLNKVFLVDEDGTVILVGLPRGSTLMVVANSEASLGAVSMGVTRLAAGLGQGDNS